MDTLFRTAALAASLLSGIALAACGGGSGSASSGSTDSGNGGTATIQGVSTPSSVSVVTAKNAQ